MSDYTSAANSADDVSPLRTAEGACAPLPPAAPPTRNPAPHPQPGIWRMRPSTTCDLVHATVHDPQSCACNRPQPAISRSRIARNPDSQAPFARESGSWTVLLHGIAGCGQKAFRLPSSRKSCLPRNRPRPAIPCKTCSGLQVAGDSAARDCGLWTVTCSRLQVADDSAAPDRRSWRSRRRGRGRPA